LTQPLEMDYSNGPVFRVGNGQKLSPKELERSEKFYNVKGDQKKHFCPRGEE